MFVNNTDYSWTSTSCDLCPALCKDRIQIVKATLPHPGDLSDPGYPSATKTQPAPYILAIGEAPGAAEELSGEGFAGQAGKTLDKIFAENGVARSAYGRANIVRCRPPENRKPKKDEVAHCLPYLADLIAQAHPKILLLIGGTATSLILGAGSLQRRIEDSKKSAWCDFQFAHPILRASLKAFLAEHGGLYAFPMPHTSGLAWNRKSKDGRPFSQVGREQVRAALSLLGGLNI